MEQYLEKRRAHGEGAADFQFRNLENSKSEIVLNVAPDENPVKQSHRAFPVSKTI